MCVYIYIYIYIIYIYYICTSELYMKHSFVIIVCTVYSSAARRQASSSRRRSCGTSALGAPPSPINHLYTLYWDLTMILYFQKSPWVFWKTLARGDIQRFFVHFKFFVWNIVGEIIGRSPHIDHLFTDVLLYSMLFRWHIQPYPVRLHAKLTLDSNADWNQLIH